MITTRAEARIEQALIQLVRRTTDPRGNANLKARAGIDLDRAAGTLLFRIEELGPVRLSEVAAAAGVEISTASRPVTKLVDQGYVARSGDPDDGRAALLTCTTAGMEVVERLRQARQEWMRDVLADFDPVEQTTLADLFERFVDRVVALSAPAGGTDV